MERTVNAGSQSRRTGTIDMSPPKSTTRSALERSLEHWRENIKKAEAGTLTWADISGEKCSLCHVHFTNLDCGTCPVKISTGQSHCYGTPYYVARTALYAVIEMEDSPDKGLRQERKQALIDACHLEVTFLEGLLP